MAEATVVTSENMQEFALKKLGIEPIKEEAKEEIKEEIKDEKSEEVSEEKHEEAEVLDEHESDDGKEEKPRKKNAFSERIKKLTDQRNAERQARAELEARLKAIEEKVSPGKPQDPNEKPNPNNFKDAFEYAEKLAEWSAKEAIRKKDAEEQVRKAQEAHEKRATTWKSKIEKTREELEDYDEVLESADVVVSDEVRDAILESEIGPRLIYELAKNPEIAEKIAGMTVLGALREIGKLEAKIESKAAEKPEKQVAKASKAPEPINPIRGARATVEAVDGDGKVNVSFAEYKRLRKEGKIK